MKIKHHTGFSEKGQRDNNEDYILTSSDSKFDITVVCDGVGGAHKGEAASELACLGIVAYLEDQKIINESTLQDAVGYVLSEMDAYANSNPYSDGMATTLTIAIQDEETVHLMHIGDSKILCIMNGRVGYESDDHSLVNKMVETGLISEEEALVHPKRNVITRALAAGSKKAEPTIKTISGWSEGDAIFLCTDGVLESFTTEDLAALIISNRDDQEIVDRIRETCLAHSKDNYSGFLLRF